MSLPEDLLKFRAVYLKAIAKAWQDEQFRSDFCRPNQALPMLKKHFNYECPWKIDFTVTDNNEGPFFNELRGMYMTSPLNFDKFVLYIPKKPQKGNVAEAAACFYDNNPMLLPSKCTDKTKSYLPSPVVPPVLESSHKAEISEYSSNHLSVTTYDLGVSEKHFSEFGSVILCALGLAWDNKTFKKAFISPDDATEYPPIDQSVSLLKEWLNYDYPWDVDLVIKEDPLATFVFIEKYENNSGEEFTLVLDEENGNRLASEGEKVSDMNLITSSWDWAWIKDGQLFQSTPLGLVLSLPEKPEHVTNNVVALGRYNTDGAGFPFTC